MVESTPPVAYATSLSLIKEGVRGSSKCPSAERPGELGVSPSFFKVPQRVGDYQGVRTFRACNISHQLSFVLILILMFFTI